MGRMGSIPPISHPNPGQRRRSPPSSFRPVTAVTSSPPMETSSTTELTAKGPERDLGLTRRAAAPRDAELDLWPMARLN